MPDQKAERAKVQKTLDALRKELREIESGKRKESRAYAKVLKADIATMEKNFRPFGVR